MKSWSPPDSDEKFEITAMIDLVFLLVAFFMTVTSFASADMVKIIMPVAHEAKLPEEVGDRQFISISESGSYFWGSRISNLEEIKDLLQVRANTEGFKGAYIRADANTPHKYVSDLMKTCAEADVYNIIFGTLQE